MQASHYPSGASMVGSIPTTHAAGFNGTAGITWDAACQAKTNAKSDDGKRCGGMSPKFDDIASLAISDAGHVSDKRSCTGHLIVGRFEATGKLSI